MHVCYYLAQTSVNVLIDYRPALRSRTGVGEWVHCLVSALAEINSAGDGLRSLDLTVFSSSWKDRLLVQDLPKAVGTLDRHVPVSFLNYFWHQFNWPPVEFLTRTRFDVVHSPHPLLIPSKYAAQVITIHDLDFLDHPERTDAEVQRDYPKLVQRHAQRADQVVVPSQHTASEVEKRLGVNPASITLCPNGAPRWPARKSLPPTGHILFVGSITPRKNIGVLLDAYAELLGKREDLPSLILAGPTSSRNSKWLELIESSPFNGRVKCTGYLNRAELKKYYDNALVLVLPSLNEGFGLPALEAMTIGVPVVASNRGALPEIVGNSGLLVDPTRPSDLASAIEQMIYDRSFAQICVKNGLRGAARFSWHNSAKHLLQAYSSAVSAKSARLAKAQQLHK